MAKKVIFYLDENVIAFLAEVGGIDQSVYLNNLLKREQQKKLEEDTLRDNREEAEDAEYQKELSHWDVTLFDGLL